MDFSDREINVLVSVLGPAMLAGSQRTDEGESVGPRSRTLSSLYFRLLAEQTRRDDIGDHAPAERHAAAPSALVPLEPATYTVIVKDGAPSLSRAPHGTAIDDGKTIMVGELP